MAKPARPSAVRADDLLEGDVTEAGTVHDVTGQGAQVVVAFKEGHSVTLDRVEYVDIEN